MDQVARSSRMVIDMNVSRIKNVEQARSFISGTLDVQFVIADGVGSKFGIKPDLEKTVTSGLYRFTLLFYLKCSSVVLSHLEQRLELCLSRSGFG